MRRVNSWVAGTACGAALLLSTAVAAVAQQPPSPRPNVPTGDFTQILNGILNGVVRQSGRFEWETTGGFGEFNEGFVIWEDDYGGDAPRDRPEAEEIQIGPDGRPVLAPRARPPAPPARAPAPPARPPGGGGGGSGGSNLVSGGGGGGPALSPINLPRRIRRDQAASVVSTNGFRSVLFTPIYQNSTVYQTVTFGPSSAGASGFDAVPWISRWGTGVSSAGNSLSSLGGAGANNVDRRTNTGIFEEVTRLRTEGRFAEAQALLDRTAPAQFGGTIGAAQNMQFYLGIVQAFINGDPARLEAIYNSAEILQAIGGYTGLTADQVRQQLAGLNNFDIYRGAFIRTAAGDLIGVGGMGLIRGQLIWTTTADLDLHMFIPGGSPTPGGAGHVYYANKTVTFNSGQATAQLDHDNLGGAVDAPPNRRVENIVITGSLVPPGAYTFFVYNFSANGNVTTPFTLTLTGNGGRTTTVVTGTLGNGQQSPNTVVTTAGGAF